MSRIKKQILSKLKEYGSKMGTNTMGGDDYTSGKRGGLRDNDGYDNVQYNKNMPQDESVVNERNTSVNKRRAGAELKQKLKGKRSDGMGKYTATIYGLDSNGKRVELKSLNDLNKYSKFELDESVVNEGKVDRVVGHTRYKYVGDGRKGQAIVSGPMKDREKEAIIKRAKKAGYSAKPNMGGGVTIHVESVNESMFSAIDQIRQDSKDVRDFVKKVFKDREFKKMSNDKDFIKYLKSIYEGINESIPQNFHQGRVSDYHTALRGKQKDYSGGTNFKKKSHGQPDIDTDDEDQETNHLSNKQLHVKAKLKVAESGKKKSDKNYKDWKNTNEDLDNLSSTERIELYKLYSRAMKAMPGSPNQKKIKVLINKLRKKADLKSLPENTPNSSKPYILDDESILKGTPEDKDAIDKDIDETAKRDYKDEYKKFQSSTKSKKYRAELNKYNRDKGTYGNGDGKDASHKGGKIVGFESASKNRGRAEKSRLKKK